jgi:hypothetical protein
MATFYVQLWPDGTWDQEGYRQVEALSAQEAAEKLYGRTLQDRGSNSQIRAQVRSFFGAKHSPVVFYEIQ